MMKYQAQPDNVKDLFQTGTIYENSLSIAGGDAKIHSVQLLQL